MAQAGLPVPLKIWAKDLPASAGQYKIRIQCNPLSRVLQLSHWDGSNENAVHFSFHSAI
jgi:hypothetical protein